MFSNFCFIFFTYFYPKTQWTIQKWGNFYNLSFFKSSDLSLGLKKFFFAVFGWYFTPWIRIFLRIRIQEAKILRIQRILILSTASGIEFKLHFDKILLFSKLSESWTLDSQQKKTVQMMRRKMKKEYMSVSPELRTLEWWISRSMLDLLFFLISRLT